MDINETGKQKLIEALLKSSGGRLQRAAVSRAADGQDPSALIGMLSPEERARLTELTNNREKLEELLKSPQSQQILRSVLKGGNGNGRNKR